MPVCGKWMCVSMKPGVISASLYVVTSTSDGKDASKSQALPTALI